MFVYVIGALREGNVPKLALNDLSNRVKRVIRSGTPQKTAFAGKKLSLYSGGGKQENFDYYKLENRGKSFAQKEGNQSISIPINCTY